MDTAQLCILVLIVALTGLPWLVQHVSLPCLQLSCQMKAQDAPKQILKNLNNDQTIWKSFLYA